MRFVASFLLAFSVVGLTEEQARKKHQVRIFISRFKPMVHTLSGRDDRTMMKLIVDKDTDASIQYTFYRADNFKVPGYATVWYGAGVKEYTIAAALKRFFVPSDSFSSSRKCSARSSMSLPRSRNGGSWIGNTFNRW